MKIFLDRRKKRNYNFNINTRKQIVYNRSIQRFPIHREKDFRNSIFSNRRKKMKKQFIAILTLFFTAGLSFGQNLLNDASFESGNLDT